MAVVIKTVNSLGSAGFASSGGSAVCSSVDYSYPTTHIIIILLELMSINRPLRASEVRQRNRCEIFIIHKEPKWSAFHLQNKYRNKKYIYFAKLGNCIKTKYSFNPTEGKKKSGACESENDTRILNLTSPWVLTTGLELTKLCKGAERSHHLRKNLFVCLFFKFQELIIIWEHRFSRQD